MQQSLHEIDQVGKYLITNEEVKGIFLYERGAPFTYDRQRHALLVNCLDDPELQALFKKEDWAPEEQRKVLEGVEDNLAWSIGKFDAGLIGYAQDVGNREVLCENFGGFLTAGRDQYGYGVPGVYVQRLLSEGVKLLKNENYPNIFSFTNDLAAITNDFKNPLDCTKLPRVSVMMRLWSDAKREFRYWIW